jgi:hypothetical protein
MQQYVNHNGKLNFVNGCIFLDSFLHLCLKIYVMFRSWQRVLFGEELNQLGPPKENNLNPND